MAIFEIDDDELLPSELWIGLVKYRAQFRCEYCGRHQRERRTGLAAHHRDGNPSNNRLSNGSALCAACHARTHAAMQGRSFADDSRPFVMEQAAGAELAMAPRR